MPESLLSADDQARLGDAIPAPALTSIGLRSKRCARGGTSSQNHACGRGWMVSNARFRIGKMARGT